MPTTEYVKLLAKYQELAAALQIVQHDHREAIARNGRQARETARDLTGYMIATNRRIKTVEADLRLMADIVVHPA